LISYYIPGFWGYAVPPGLMTVDHVYRRTRHVVGIDKVLDEIETELKTIKPDVVYGHSWGGFLALKLAERGFRGRLILLYPGLPSNYFFISTYIFRFFLRGIVGGHKPSFDRWMKWARISDLTIAKNLHEIQQPEHSWHILEFLFRRPQTFVDFAKIKNDVLICIAEHDELCPPNLQRRLANDLEKGVIKEVGHAHYSFFENQDVANQIQELAEKRHLDTESKSSA